MKLMRFSLTGLALLLTGSSVPVADAQEQTPGAIKVQMSPLKDTVMVGEPIKVTIEIRNVDKQAVTVREMPEKAGDWIRFELLTGDGLNRISRSRDPIDSTLRPLGTFRLEPESSYKVTQVVYVSATPRKSGEYRLVGIVSLSYKPEGRAEGFRRLTAELQAPLKARRGNNQALEGIARDLGKKVLDDKSIDERRLAVDALLAMPESVGLPIWRALAADPALYKSEGAYFTHRLGLLKTQAAAELLAQMWIHVNAPSEHGDLGARSRLIEMYHAGPPALRRYIAQLFQRIEGKLPPPRDGNIVVIDH